jgi:hypothetical protein
MFFKSIHDTHRNHGTTGQYMGCFQFLSHLLSLSSDFLLSALFFIFLPIFLSPRFLRFQISFSFFFPYPSIFFWLSSTEERVTYTFRNHRYSFTCHVLLSQVPPWHHVFLFILNFSFTYRSSSINIYEMIQI